MNVCTTAMASVSVLLLLAEAAFLIFLGLMIFIKVHCTQFSGRFDWPRSLRLSWRWWRGTYDPNATDDIPRSRADMKRLAEIKVHNESL